MKTWILNWIGSPVFWRGLIALSMAGGITLEPAQQNAILAAGLALSGLVHAWDARP